MKQTLRYVVPLVVFAFILTLRCPAPIIYREGEGFLPGDAEDIEIKKNAQEQFDLGQRYENHGDWGRAGASYRMVVRRFPRADMAQPHWSTRRRCTGSKASLKKSSTTHQPSLNHNLEVTIFNPS